MGRVEHGSELIEVAKRMTPCKPIIAIKAGRSLAVGR
jgi:acyl-CoA synthetase (NDP forming)